MATSNHRLESFLSLFRACQRRSQQSYTAHLSNVAINLMLAPAKQSRRTTTMFAMALMVLGIACGPIGATAEIDFTRDVQPLLTKHCLECHGATKRRGGFRVDSSRSVFGEADSGERPIVPGESADSELIRRIVSRDEGERMPPDGPRLSAQQLSTLVTWIDQGATWPSTADVIDEPGGEMQVTDSDRRHWAFRKLSQQAPPDAYAAHPIDRFVDARMQDSGIQRNGPASPHVLLRRLTFDVTGLPPQAGDVQKLASSDEAFDVTERIDQLLQSPAFGERWARIWLDVVRYADSRGYESDQDEPNAYQYRDFVIRAFNQDMPFDQFVRWQIAGDELAPDHPDAVTATGFLAVGPKNRAAPTAPDEVHLKIRADELDDIVATTGQAFLGLTVGCARCHDHKYDPIPTRDYYRMVSAFASIECQDSPPVRPIRELDVWTKRSKAKLYAEKLEAIDCTEDERKWLSEPQRNPAESKSAHRRYGKHLVFDDGEWRAWLGPEDRRVLDALEAAAEQVQSLRESWQAQPALYTVDRGRKPVPVRLLKRGDVGLPADQVSLGFLSVLMADKSAEQFHEECRRQVSGQTTAQRAALATWITDTNDGAGELLARVIVNRIWQGYFGKGLVGTPNDFGLQGEVPTHPRLLDWLASQLIKNDWQLKSIHRLILTSQTYQQASRFDAKRSAIDPANKLWWRKVPIRLNSEAIRDSILAVSGRLNQSMYGPGVRPFIPSGAIASRSGDKWPADVVEGPQQWRRSLYIFVKRSIRFPMMEAFDAPDPSASCGRRIPTTVPVQALTMMNNPNIRGAAVDFAATLRDQVGSNDEAAITLAYQTALARSPVRQEQQLASDFLAVGDPKTALADFCHALFLMNEFVYVD
ncbi:MAG: PSD1 and planctomycete cytochrome C domain-containing protein [Planctomycetota bacterium]